MSSLTVAARRRRQPIELCTARPEIRQGLNPRVKGAVAFLSPLVARIEQLKQLGGDLCRLIHGCLPAAEFARRVIIAEY